MRPLVLALALLLALPASAVAQDLNESYRRAMQAYALCRNHVDLSPGRATDPDFFVRTYPSELVEPCRKAHEAWGQAIERRKAEDLGAVANRIEELLK